MKSLLKSAIEQEEILQGAKKVLFHFDIYILHLPNNIFVLEKSQKMNVMGLLGLNMRERLSMNTTDSETFSPLPSFNQ